MTARAKSGPVAPSLLLLSLLFATCVLAAAQPAAQVRGVVQDPTGAAVSGAEVTITSGSEQRSATTGEDGSFSVASGDMSSATVEVQAPGFQNVSQQWTAGEGAMKMVLPLARVSNSITVASRTPIVLSDATASVDVITQQDFAQSGSFALDDVLRQVPGFSLFRRSGSMTSNPTTMGVSMRGVGASGASRALVLLDGIPLNDPFGGWVYWSRIPRTAVERVEVSRGGESALYGSDALGGVISVQTPRFENFGLSAETFMGNEGTPMGSMTGNVDFGKWTATLSGEAFRTGGYIPTDPAERGSVDSVSNSKHGNGSLRLGRKLGDSGHFFIDGSMFGEQRHNGTVLQANSTTIRQLSTGLDWNSAAAGTFAVRVFGGTENYRQNFTSISLDRNSESLVRDQSVPVYQLGGSFVWSRSFGAHHLVAGTDMRKINGETDEIGFFNGRATSRLQAGGQQNTVGVFIEDLYRLTSNWMLTGSARVDRWSNVNARSLTTPLSGAAQTLVPFPDRTQSAFSPRLGLLRRITQNVTLSASGYRSFRAPTLNELYRGFRVGNVQTNANADLNAERVTGAEATLEAQALSAKLHLHSTYFWNRVYGPVGNITLGVTPALITRQRQNIGRTSSQGVELGADYQLNARTSFGAGYQFDGARVDQFPADTTLVGLLIPQTPRQQFTVNFAYSNPRLVTLALQGRYMGQQFDDDQNQFPLDHYFNLDASISHRVRPGMEVFVAAQNLTNSRYDIGRTPVRSIAAPIFARVGLRFDLGEAHSQP